MTTYATVHHKTVMFYKDGVLVGEIPVSECYELVSRIIAAWRDRKPDAAETLG